jgi:hypothetical protein
MLNREKNNIEKGISGSNDVVVVVLMMMTATTFLTAMNLYF